MSTIFFTIYCVEQLTFYKTFDDQLQFEQLIFFCLKVKLLEIHIWQMIFDFQPVFTFLSTAGLVLSSWYFCVDQFFWAIEFWAVDHLPFQDSFFTLIASREAWKVKVWYVVSIVEQGFLLHILWEEQWMAGYTKVTQINTAQLTFLFSKDITSNNMF